MSAAAGQLVCLSGGDLCDEVDDRMNPLGAVHVSLALRHGRDAPRKQLRLRMPI